MAGSRHWQSRRTQRTLVGLVFLSFGILASLRFLVSKTDIEYGGIAQLRNWGSGYQGHDDALSGGASGLEESDAWQPGPLNITLIALWSPRPDSHPPAYLPNFFESVRYNPSIHLLFIVHDRWKLGCDTIGRISPDYPNIEEHCLDEVEYWRMHEVYLCGHWKCDETEREWVMDALVRRGAHDWVNTHFRPFRAGVFSKWVDPRTPMWGWCDMDVALGSFERQFPWDIASKFDVLVPVQPSVFERIQLFTPGHLAFFRNDPRVMREFFNYHRLKTAWDWLASPEQWIGEGADEGEWSHFALTNPRLTFVTFHALLWTHKHITTVSRGIYGVVNEESGPLLAPTPWSISSPDPMYLNTRTQLSKLIDEHIQGWNDRVASLPLPESAPDSDVDPLTGLAKVKSKAEANGDGLPPPYFAPEFEGRRTDPTFTPEGVEYTVDLQAGKHPPTWMKPELVVHYEPDYEHEAFKKVKPAESRRYVMRRKRNGPVTERVESGTRNFAIAKPLEDLDAPADKYTFESRPFLAEGLYIHYQQEKFQLWWNLPDKAIGPSDTLYIDAWSGAQAWRSEGEVFFDQWTHS